MYLTQGAAPMRLPPIHSGSERALKVLRDSAPQPSVFPDPDSFTTNYLRFVLLLCYKLDKVSIGSPGCFVYAIFKWNILVAIY